MTEIINFIGKHYLVLVAVIALVIYIAIKAYQMKGKPPAVIWLSVQKDIFQLMLYAEQNAPKDAEGKIKMGWAVQQFLKWKLPVQVALYIQQNYATVEQFLQDQYYNFKDWCDNGKIDGSITFPATWNPGDPGIPITGEDAEPVPKQKE